MSVPEPPIQSQDSVCQIPDRKPRPSIPKKPDSESLPPAQSPREVSKVAASGNVKNIVSKFNRQRTLGNEQPTEGGMDPPRKPKRPPTVRPKPRERNRSARASQTPPLPARRSRIVQKSPPEAQVETQVTEPPAKQDEGRPAPEGKEVDAPVAGTVTEEVPVDDGVVSSEMPSSPACSKDCGCICHLKRPGMRLVWVLEEEEEEDDEEEEDEEEEDEEEEDQEDKEGEEVEEVESEYEKVESEGKEEEDGEEGAEDGDTASEAEEKTCGSQPLDKASKQKFWHTLDYVIKRKSISGTSEPGVQEPLCVSIPTLIVPEEDNIYEDVLEPIHLQPKVNHPGALCQSLPNPKSHPEPLEAENEPVPPIPPRVPIVHDKANSPRPVPGGILLPQLFPDDRRSLRPVSPVDRSQSGSQALRPQAQTSPLLPPRRCKDPAPRSSPDGSSSNSLSAQSATQLDHKEEKPEEEEVDSKQEWSKLALSRKMSEDWNSQLQDEPLYQTYRATVITKEIRRQTVCRNISKTSADYVMEWGVNNESKAGTAQNTLWQNLPSVKSSGILKTLSTAECKYQESMFEVLTSEASYLRSLRVLTDHFLESRDLDETLVVHDKKTLFSNILRVREVSERFLKDLEDRMNESLVISDICDIIHYHAQHNFPAYIDYVRNQIYQEKTYSNLMQTNAQFAAVVIRLQELPQCQRLPLMSFLLLPFQRITRLKMLIENILKRTKEGTKEELSASKALNSVSKIIEACNTEVGKMKQVEELIHFSKILEFEKIKAIPIISQNRFLEKNGELQEMAKGSTLFSLRPKFTPTSLFLFNDLLIIAIKKSAERHVVIDHAHRSLVQVQPVTESSAGLILENCFSLTLLENHQGRMYERLFKAPSQSDMHRWLAAFPDPENMERETNEVVYQDWDCPQVHCIEQYVAQQSDELSLEPTDIVNVLRKTNEGWYQGIRLSDGQKGWFPVRCVQEITNEHVRRRNLRERFRLIQAADAMTRARTGP